MTDLLHLNVRNSEELVSTSESHKWPSCMETLQVSENVSAILVEVKSLQRMETRVGNMVPRAREKLQEAVDVADWKSFMEDWLQPVLDEADSDLKVATRRISAVNKRIKDASKGKAAEASVKATEKPEQAEQEDMGEDSSAGSEDSEA